MTIDIRGVSQKLILDGLFLSLLHPYVHKLALKVPSTLICTFGGVLTYLDTIGITGGLRFRLNPIEINGFKPLTELKLLV
jgi:hypothetical protein